MKKYHSLVCVNLLLITIKINFVQLKSVPLLNVTATSNNATNGNRSVIIATNDYNNKASNGSNNASTMVNFNSNNSDNNNNESMVYAGNAGLINTDLNYLKQDVFDLNNKKSLEQYLRAWTKYHTPNRQLPTAQKNNPITHQQQQQQRHQHSYTHFNEHGIDNSTLSIYLSFAINRLNRQHQHHYFEFRHYWHNWRRQELQTVIKSNEIAHCRHPDDGTYLCPLNTRPLCTINGTIYCVTAMNKTRPCSHANGWQCVQSLVPCIIARANVDGRGFVNRKSAMKCQADKGMWMERINMPCLTDVIVDDEYERQSRNGGRTTLIEVSGTFVLVAAVPKKDRTFCAPIIVDFVPFDKR